MSAGYQQRDAAIVDYQLWRPTPDHDWLRGPPPPSLAPGSYIACVGAAQTFGCFVARPWPALLGEQLGVPVLNLGVAGAGPALFRQPQFRALLAGARLVVFQVLSGRSADNSQFTSGGRERLRRSSDGQELGADAAWSQLLHRDLAGLHSPLRRGLTNRWRAWFGRQEVKALVRETQADWVANFQALLDAVPCRKLLFWFSQRTPQHRPRYHSLPALFGAYPQLVDTAMVDAVAAHADGYVQCVTSRGSPQPLLDRHTGAPTTVCPADAGTGESPTVRWTHNAYYPSPAMHEDAAAALRSPVGALLQTLA